MARKNKTFEPKGQKETKDLFRELFDKHLPSKNQETTSKLELGVHRGFADPWKGFNPHFSPDRIWEGFEGQQP